MRRLNRLTALCCSLQLELLELLAVHQIVRLSSSACIPHRLLLLVTWMASCRRSWRNVRVRVSSSRLMSLRVTPDRLNLLLVLTWQFLSVTQEVSEGVLLLACARVVLLVA